MVFIVAVNFFKNYGHSGVSTAVEMYGTVVLVIFLRLLKITVTVAFYGRGFGRGTLCNVSKSKFRQFSSNFSFPFSFALILHSKNEHTGRHRRQNITKRLNYSSL